MLAKSRPNECNLLVTSSNDFLPKFLTFIISASVLFVKSSTVDIPALFKQLNDLADKDRLIGIISHVNELKEQIDHKLVVKKNEKGSSVSWSL